MSKEQIYEMQDDLKNCHTQFVFDFEVHTDYYETASKLVNIGYRKQSDGEWKKTTEPMGWHEVDCVECSSCGESWVLGDNLDFDLIDEYWHFCPNCGAKMKGERYENQT